MLRFIIFFFSTSLISRISQTYRLLKVVKFLLQAPLCSSLSIQLVPQSQATLLLTVHER